MKRLIATLITVCILLSSCGMKSEIYLRNLKNLYPDAEITVQNGVYSVKLTDVKTKYVESLSRADTDGERITATLTDKNIQTFVFSDNAFSDYKVIATFLVGDSEKTYDVTLFCNAQEILGDVLEIGIPEGECTLVVRNDNVVGVL